MTTPTRLDQFVPDGEYIHPYDVNVLLNKSKTVLIKDYRTSPEWVDEEDYQRNVKKMGSQIIVDGKKYFMTTSVPPKTEEGLAMLNGMFEKN